MNRLDLDRIEKLMERIPNWQRSRFVDSPRYDGLPESWKEARRREEARMIRDVLGSVGSPECNALFKVEGPNITDDIMDFIADAPEIVRSLLRELREARDRLDDAADAIELIE